MLSHHLPKKSVVAAAISTYRQNHDGKLPNGLSPNEDLPEGWPNGWQQLIKRIKEEWGLTPSKLLDQQGYSSNRRIQRRVKKKIETSLPEKSVVAAAIDAYRKNHDGKLPDGRSPDQDLPQGWPNGWLQLIKRMRVEWGLTPSTLLGSGFIKSTI